jgi:hypothetical protein
MVCLLLTLIEAHIWEESRRLSRHDPQ